MILLIIRNLLDHARHEIVEANIWEAALHLVAVVFGVGVGAAPATVLLSPLPLIIL